MQSAEENSKGVPFNSLKNGETRAGCYIVEKTRGTCTCTHRHTHTIFTANYLNAEVKKKKKQ